MAPRGAGLGLPRFPNYRCRNRNRRTRRGNLLAPCPSKFPAPTILFGDRRQFVLESKNLLKWNLASYIDYPAEKPVFLHEGKIAQTDDSSVLKIVMRTATMDRERAIDPPLAYSSISDDGGQSWSLGNPSQNCPTTVQRASSERTPTGITFMCTAIVPNATGSTTKSNRQAVRGRDRRPSISRTIETATQLWSRTLRADGSQFGTVPTIWTAAGPLSDSGSSRSNDPQFRKTIPAPIVSVKPLFSVLLFSWFRILPFQFIRREPVATMCYSSPSTT